MNVVAYCRVSTNIKDQLNSLQTQRDFFEAYASKMGYDLIHIYSDKGLSGTKTTKRDGFNEMMEDAKTGNFQIILVKDISRLARNTVDLLKSCRILRDHGVEVQFLNYKMTNMGNSEFLLTMYAALAQEESYNTSQRIKFSKKHNASMGKIPNMVYGYDKTKGDYFELAINHKEAEVVKNIFQWYTEEGDGTLKIAQKLNKMGIKTKKNHTWTQNSISRILHHDIYIGKVINGKEEIVNFPESKRVKQAPEKWITTQNENLRIIDDITFFKAQEIMKSRSHTFQTDKKRHSNKYLFSTLIKCKECGWSFRRTVKTYQNTYVRWVCSARNGHGRNACENAISVDENDLIHALQAYFSSLLANKEQYIENAIQHFEALFQAKYDKKAKQKELLEKIEELKNLKEREISLFSNGFITMDELNERIGYIKIELPRLEHELTQNSAQYLDRKQLHSILLDFCQNIENITDIREMSNAALKRIVKEITVDNDGNIDIYLNPLDKDEL